MSDDTSERSEDALADQFEQERAELAAKIHKAMLSSYIGPPPPMLRGDADRAVGAVITAGWVPGPMARTVSRNPSDDPRLADDRDIVYRVEMTNETVHRWTGSANLVSQNVRIGSGPMVLLADDGTLLPFAQVVTMEPLPGPRP